MGDFLAQRTFFTFILCLFFTNLVPCLALCRLLIAGTESSDLQQILSLLGSTKDLLLTSSYLSDSISTGKHIEFLVTQYLNATDSRWCSWSVSTTVGGRGGGGGLFDERCGQTEAETGFRAHQCIHPCSCLRRGS